MIKTNALLVFIVIAPNLLLADDFSLLREKDSDNFILEAKTCLALRQEVEAIAQWAESLGEKPRLTTIDCKKSPIRKLDISKVLPSYFKHLAGKEAICYGPNCFNFALIGQNLHKYPRAVSKNELTLTLELFCKNISDDNLPPLPGDIGVIRDKLGRAKFDEVHAFNFIGKTVATKNGESITARLQIQDRTSMLSYYKVEPHCQKGTQIPKDCHRYVNYYRCAPALPEGKEIEEFEILEAKLSESLYDDNSVGDITSLIGLFDLMKERVKDSSSQLLKEKIESIEYQLKRRQPIDEDFLLTVVIHERVEDYEKVRLFLQKAISDKIAEKSFPLAARQIIQKIMDKRIAFFYADIEQTLPFLAPVFRKKIQQDLIKAGVKLKEEIHSDSE